jgi:putative radical SAM enzyme (TIGR03279 family)
MNEKQEKQHIIKYVEADSIAEEVGIEIGDQLISINGQPIKDALDYHFYLTEEYLEVLIKKVNGDEWLVDIEKDEDETLGIEFESSLMDEYKSCTNNCVFCFIDQLPKGMRETLYFKDDDSRLSFLQGNYITLTNMKESDVDRIIKYRLSPINISVHTTNSDLRVKMLHNRFAGNILNYIQKFYEAGIIMNGQIVLCKGLNDGDELSKSIEDLSRFIPYMQSVSVVPVGLSRHRDNLYPLQPFTKEDGQDVLKRIHKLQETLFKKHGTHFIHAGDEFYLLAEEEVPSEDNYDGYLQLENGVGMLRLFLDEFEDAFAELDADKSISKEIAVVTGMLAYDTIKAFSKQIENKLENIKIYVYPIKNEYFGERITVSGLLTGQDIINQLTGQELGEKLLLPNNLLKSGEPVLLDDVSVSDIEKALQVQVAVVQSIGKDFIQSIIN